MAGRPHKRRIPKPKGAKPKRSRSSAAMDPEVTCSVPKCTEFADTALGGRSIAFDNAVDVWENIPEGPRRVKVCRTHYKEWKKSKKDDETEWS